MSRDLAPMAASIRDSGWALPSPQPLPHNDLATSMRWAVESGGKAIQAIQGLVIKLRGGHRTALHAGMAASEPTTVFNRRDGERIVKPSSEVLRQEIQSMLEVSEQVWTAPCASAGPLRNRCRPSRRPQSFPHNTSRLVLNIADRRRNLLVSIPIYHSPHDGCQRHCCHCPELGGSGAVRSSGA